MCQLIAIMRTALSSGSFGSARLGSVRFGSVRFGKTHFPVRCGSACVFLDASWLGPVRFRVRFRNQTVRFGSVRFGRFGSVSYSFLPTSRPRHDRVALHLRQAREGLGLRVAILSTFPAWTCFATRQRRGGGANLSAAQ